jgi:hypothetical protein
MAYAQYNGGLRVAEGAQLITTAERIARTINFTAGANFVVITDVDLTDLSALGLPSIRQTTAGDLITLPTRTLLGTLADPGNPSSVRGVGVPLANSNVLTVREQARVTSAQNSYNATIAALAQANGLALVDVKTALQSVAQGGVAFNGGILTSTYVTGGGFSLDGVHPTPRGYAFTANTILNAINATYGSTVPRVDIGNYKSVQLSNGLQ